MWGILRHIFRALDLPTREGKGENQTYNLMFAAE